MLAPISFLSSILALSSLDIANTEDSGIFFEVDPESLMSPENGLLLLATVCIGGLVGLVRQWNGGERTTAGMRTFSIWAMLGFVAAQMECIGFKFFTLTILVLLGISVAVLLWRGGKIRVREETTVQARFGLTTGGAALVIFCVGALMGVGQEKYAIMIAVVLAAALALNAWTDRFASSLTGTDVRAGLQFAFLTGILLPLVPNQQIWGLFNLYTIWLMVVLISGVNFIGYIAMRWLGARAGAALTGVIGGLASSTAVTLSFSKRSREEPEDGGAFALAILLAQFSMALRLVILVCVLNITFAAATAHLWAILLGVCAAVCGVLALSHGSAVQGAVPEIKNPLDLRTALKFGALYAVVVFLIERTGNDAGASFAVVSFLSGIPDTAAIVMSMANQATEVVTEAATTDNMSLIATETSLSFRLAALGAMIGVFSNTLVKLGIALVLGRGIFRKYALLGLGCTLAANLGVIVWLFFHQ